MYTRAREMMENISMVEDLMSEEMTSHPWMGAALMNFPSNYRGLAKVTKIRDQEAKNWLGLDTVLYVDLASGESNMLTPAGAMATVADLTKVFDLEVFEPHP